MALRAPRLSWEPLGVTLVRHHWWFVGFGLRCATLLVLELATFLNVVPTLFDLHRDSADVAAAILALAALAGGYLAVAALTREAQAVLTEKDHD